MRAQLCLVIDRTIAARRGSAVATERQQLRRRQRHVARTPRHRVGRVDAQLLEIRHARQRAGRLIFAACVASLTAWFIIGPNVRAAPLMALAALSVMTPFLDRFLPASRFQWGKASMSKEGRDHETQTPVGSRHAGARLARP